MLPLIGVRLAAAAVIAAEFLVAGLLQFQRARRAGWLLTAGLCAAFAVVYAAALALGDIRERRCLAARLTRDGWYDHVIMLAICVALCGAACLALVRDSRSTPVGAPA